MICLLQGDNTEILPLLPRGSVHCVMTSPPYYGVRDYKVTPTLWPEMSYTPMHGLEPVTVPYWEGCLGAEPTVSEFIGHLVHVFREVHGVLRDDGTCWVNLGDTYSRSRSKFEAGEDRSAGSRSGAAGHVGYTQDPTLPDLNLNGIPWRFALAMQADGWLLRSECIWDKPNAMPESVADRRPNKVHEQVFMFAKKESYYYDCDAVREPLADSTIARDKYTRVQADAPRDGQYAVMHDHETPSNPDGRHRRSVWRVALANHRGKHAATYPRKLCTTPIAAGTSDGGICPSCGAPMARETKKTAMVMRPGPKREGYGVRVTDHLTGTMVSAAKTEQLGWSYSCECPERVLECDKAIVLDPFSGTATTGCEAVALGRNYIGIEANPESIAEARIKLSEVASPFFDPITVVKHDQLKEATQCT